MKDIPLGARVDCTDGRCGESTAVIINPVTQEITHLVVRDETQDDPVPRLVSLDQIVDATEDLIKLSCTRAELSQMEEFVHVRYIRKGEADEKMYDAGEWHSPYGTAYTTSLDVDYDKVAEEQIPVGELAVHRGDHVDASDGHLGQVGEFIIDEDSGHVTHIVLLEGHFWHKKEVTIPVSAIESVKEGTVYLNLDKKAVGSLPTIPVKRHYDKGS